MSNGVFLNDHSQLHVSESDKWELYDCLGVAPDTQCFVFSSSFDAYFHLYYAIYVDIARQTGRNHILTTPIEPLSFAQGMKKIEPLGCNVKKLTLNNQGQVTTECLEPAVGPRTSILSLTWANALTGIIHPIEEIAAFCKQKGVLLHVDATHLFGKHFFRLQDYGIDILTLSIKGKTLLFKKKEIPLHFAIPTDHSAHFCSEEVRLLSDRFDHVCTETARLVSRLEKGILSAVPESQILFQKVERLPNCTSIAIPGVAGESLAFLLGRKGIHVTTGGQGHQKLAQILMQCGVPQALSHAAISFALAYETQEFHIDRAIESVTAIAKKLRRYTGTLL